MHKVHFLQRKCIFFFLTTKLTPTRFFLIALYWSIIASQYCVSSCCTYLFLKKKKERNSSFENLTWLTQTQPVHGPVSGLWPVYPGSEKQTGSVTSSVSGMWPLELRGKLHLLETLVPLGLCVVLLRPSSRTEGAISPDASLLVPTQDSSQRPSRLQSALWLGLRPLLRPLGRPISPVAHFCFSPPCLHLPVPGALTPGHSTINFLPTNLHLRVCFLGDHSATSRKKGWCRRIKCAPQVFPFWPCWALYLL